MTTLSLMPLKLPTSVKKIQVIALLFILLFSLKSTYGLSISINDTISVDFDNGVSGTSEIEYVGHYAGDNEYGYSVNVPQERVLLFQSMQHQ